VLEIHVPVLHKFLMRRSCSSGLPSGLVHRNVNHKEREFSRPETIFGVEVVVSTNSAEGLFGRVKVFARSKGRKRISKDAYGLILAEFMWR
jgi:hypothetical protein